MVDNNIDTSQFLHMGDELRSSRAMHSADVAYLWRLSDMCNMPLRIYMEVANVAIDDRIPPKGLKE